MNADVIIYLDEDNWIDPCHVEKLVKVFPKTFSNNSTYILDLKKSVMDKLKKHYKEAEIFDCGIPSAQNIKNINNWSKF